MKCPDHPLKYIRQTGRTLNVRCKKAFTQSETTTEIPVIQTIIIIITDTVDIIKAGKKENI
jgi:hypothetical protein